MTCFPSSFFQSTVVTSRPVSLLRTDETNVLLDLSQTTRRFCISYFLHPFLIKIAAEHFEYVMPEKTGEDAEYTKFVDGSSSFFSTSSKVSASVRISSLISASDSLASALSSVLAGPANSSSKASETSDADLPTASSRPLSRRLSSSPTSPTLERNPPRFCAVPTAAEVPPTAARHLHRYCLSTRLPQPGLRRLKGHFRHARALTPLIHRLRG